MKIPEKAWDIIIPLGLAIGIAITLYFFFTMSPEEAAGLGDGI